MDEMLTHTNKHSDKHGDEACPQLCCKQMISFCN